MPKNIKRLNRIAPLPAYSETSIEDIIVMLQHNAQQMNKLRVEITRLALENNELRNALTDKHELQLTKDNVSRCDLCG